MVLESILDGVPRTLALRGVDCEIPHRFGEAIKYSL